MPIWDKDVYVYIYIYKYPTWGYLEPKYADNTYFKLGTIIRMLINYINICVYIYMCVYIHSILDLLSKNPGGSNVNTSMHIWGFIILKPYIHQPGASM